MPFVHGKNAAVTVNSVDLSAFTNSVELKESADSHDTTTFGHTAHTFVGGLKNGTVSLKGIYDDGAAGPRATLQPLLGTTTELVYKPEGTGTGKPQDTVTVLVTSYDESAAVADMVMWSAEFQLSSPIVTTDQV